MTRCRGAILVGLIMLALSGASWAQAGECEQQCAEEFSAAYGECADAYNAELERLQQEYDECRANAQSFFERLRCLSDFKAGKSQAYVDKLSCETRAEADYLRCLNDCQTSPSAP